MGTRFSTPSIRIFVDAKSIHLETPVDGEYKITDMIDFEYAKNRDFTPNTRELLRRGIEEAITEGTGGRPSRHTTTALVEYIYLQSEAMEDVSEPSQANSVLVDVRFGYPIAKIAANGAT